MDPVFAWVLRLALSVLFAAAASHKLRDFRTFSATLADYRLVPASLVGPFAVGLVAAEFGVALALIGSPEAGGVAAVVLLLLYSAAIGWNLARGRKHIDCGCLGPAGRSALSGWLLVRNAALAGAAGWLLLGTTSRTLSWLDGVSVLGGLLACILVWTAANTLAAAGAPRAFGVAR